MAIPIKDMAIPIKEYESYLITLDLVHGLPLVVNQLDCKTHERVLFVVDSVPYKINTSPIVERGIEIPRGFSKIVIDNTELFVLIGGEVAEIVDVDNSSLGFKFIPYASVITEEEFEDLLTEELEKDNRDLSFLDEPEFEKYRKSCTNFMI